MLSEKGSRFADALEFIRSRIKPAAVALITGTGLSDSLGSIRIESSVAYEQIPGFPTATVESHPGRILSGFLQGKSVLILQSRLHLYEGYRAAEVVFPVRIMQALGVRCLIVTNAAGGLNPDFRAGDMMLIADHINLTATSPLIGPHAESSGERFPDMSAAYDRDLMQLARQAAHEEGLRLRQGVYAGLTGPSLETPAEVRFLRTIGADAVGFSTVQEVIAAVQARMRILGLSVITNVHNPDCPVAAAASDIIDLARKVAPRLGAITSRVIAKI